MYECMCECGFGGVLCGYMHEKAWMNYNLFHSYGDGVFPSPVVFEKSRGDCNEGDNEVEGEGVLGAITPLQLNQVEGDYGEGDDEGLSYLHSIDTGQDVDGVGTEHSQHAHVHIVQQV